MKHFERTDSSKGREDEQKRPRPQYDVARLRAEESQRQKRKIDHEISVSSDKVGLIDDKKGNEGKKVNIANLYDNCINSIKGAIWAAKNNYLIEESEEVYEIEKLRGKDKSISELRGKDEVANKLRTTDEFANELRGMIERVEKNLDLIEQQEPEQSLGKLKELWKKFSDDFNNLLQPSQRLVEYFKQLIWESHTPDLKPLYTAHQDDLFQMLFLVEGAVFNHRVKELERDNKFIQEHINGFGEVLNKLGYDYWFTREMRKYEKSQEYLSEHYNKKYDPFVDEYVPEFKKYCEMKAKLREEIEDLLEKGIDWKVKECNEKFLKELLQMFPTSRDSCPQGIQQRWSIDGQMPEEAQRQSDSGPFFERSPQELRADPVVDPRQQHPDKKILATVSQNIEKTSLEHLNAVNEYVELRKRIMDYLQKIDKKAEKYEIWDNKEIDQAKQVIERCEKETKEVFERIKKILETKNIKYGLDKMKKEIESSHEFIEKHDEIQQKYHDNRYRLLGKASGVKKEIYNKISNIRGNRWTDIEIQIEKKKYYIMSKEFPRELPNWYQIPFLNDLPIEQALCLCTTERCQKHHDLADTMPFHLIVSMGVFKEMLNGLCIDELNFDGHRPEELTGKYLMRLHDTAVKGIYREIGDGNQKRVFELGYNEGHGDGHTAFELALGFNCSKAGLAERSKKLDCRQGGPKVDAHYGETGHPVGNCHKGDEKFDTIRHWIEPRTQEECREIVDAISNKYYEDLKEIYEDLNKSVPSQYVEETSLASFRPDASVPDSPMKQPPIRGMIQKIEEICEKLESANSAADRQRLVSLEQSISGEVQGVNLSDDLYKHWRDEISVAVDKIVTAIVRCCQDLYQVYPFHDGNLRTIAAGVLPKLFLENGLCPPILRNPEKLAGYSLEEIKDDIYDGQQIFQKLCELAGTWTGDE